VGYVRSTEEELMSARLQEYTMSAQSQEHVTRRRPAVSVIVTVLDERGAIGRLLDGLIPQLSGEDELVVVDGGSRDGTFQLLCEYAKRDGRVRALRAPGANIAAGRNMAVAAARHELIACTDAGCMVAPHWLAELAAPFATYPAPGLAAGVPHVLAKGALERAQSAACYADPYEAERPTPLVRLYGRLFGGVFDPSLPFARSLAFTRTAWRDAGGFPERLRWVEDGVFGRAVAARHSCVLAPGAEVYWEQRSSVAATLRMYYRYGIGAAASGERQLQARDCLRLLAYLAGAAMLASRARRAIALTLVGAGAYYSLPLVRVVRRRAGMRAALCIPLALAIKDFGKVAGAASVHLRGRSMDTEVRSTDARVRSMDAEGLCMDVGGRSCV
jgi:GT2 family glycosyltransferase